MPFMRMKKWPAALRCVLSLALLIGFPPVPGYAAATGVPGLPEPGTMVTASHAFAPAVLKGLTVHPDKPFHFDFIIDTGDSELRGDGLQAEADKLIRYFMAALTVPERQLWVNLSPYEENRVIPPVLGETAMGRDLLAQDYLLKQLTASMIYPESELGQRFWKRVYDRARERFGSIEIPVDTYNKIWIVPETAELFVSGRQVFVVESRLKVLLEEDYVALRHNTGRTDHGVGEAAPDTLGPAAGLSAQIVREIIVPEIEREVNEGRNFASLRQIFHSLILAAWYKQNLRQTVFAQSYVDLGKTGGITVDDPEINRRIYEQYIAAYKKGVYNYIREDYDAVTASTIPRKYFSGGVEANVTPVLQVSRSREKLGRSIKGELVTAAAYARATHTITHQQAELEPVLHDIATELGLAPDSGGYPFLREVHARGGSVDLQNGGRLDVTADGILVVIDPRLAGDHAGRGTYQLAVYARNETKARHELAELRSLIQAARELGILSATDTEDRLGIRLRAWANDVTVSDEERLARQNQLITAAHAAHQEGLIAEGRAGEAARLPQPGRLTRPVEDFDITIASGGSRALRVYNYLRYLDEEGYLPLVFSATQLLAAVIHEKPGLLAKPEAMTERIIRETYERLAEYTPEAGRDVVMAAPDLDFESANIFRKLTDILDAVIRQGDEEDILEDLDQLRYVFPQEFENPLGGVPAELLGRRLQMIGRAQRRHLRGELTPVLNFGDKHGRIEDLEIILQRVREAAAAGETLTVVGHGDGFDRGSQNVRVLEIFRELKELEQAHDHITVKLLYGNHDGWLIKTRMMRLRKDEEVWFANGGDKTAREFSQRGRSLDELMHFMLQNFDVYYIDDWGMMHIHGGFDVSLDGDPRLQADRLQALQARVEKYRETTAWDGESEFPQEEREVLWQLMDDVNRVLTISREAWDHRLRNIRVDMDPTTLEAFYGIVSRQVGRLHGANPPSEAELRDFFAKNWRELLISTPDMYYSMGLMFDLDDSDRRRFMPGRIDRFMARMGVLGVVNGHHHHNEPFQADMRIFGVDTDDARPGHLVIDSDGVRFYPVNGEVQELTDKDGLQAGWDRQRQRIMRQYSQRNLEKLFNTGKLKPPSGEDAAILVRAGDTVITMADRASYAAAARELVEQIARRNMTRLLFTGKSAFITMELIRAEWVRRFGSDWDLPPMHVIDSFGGSSFMLGWQAADLISNLRRTVSGFNGDTFREELGKGRIGLFDDHIISATKMKSYHRLFQQAFGTAPVIGALVAARDHYKHIAMRGPSPFGEFDVVAGLVDLPLAEKISVYAGEMRDEWRRLPPYRGNGLTDPLVELIKEGINDADQAILIKGASHYDFNAAERDRLADAAVNLVGKTAASGIRRVFFTGTSAFISRELFAAAWQARFGADVGMPELMVLPEKKTYTLWQPGALTKELGQRYPDLDPRRLRQEMIDGKVALIDDHASSGAKLKSFHRIFLSDLGAAPVMGALVSHSERLEHIGFNSDFGGFDVLTGVIDMDLADKIRRYADAHREQWKDLPPYTGRIALTDGLVEAVRMRLQQRDQAQLADNPGGIDLNPQAMRLSVTGDAAPAMVPAADGVIPQTDGYVPVILHITPTATLPVLLGVEGTQDSEERLSRAGEKQHSGGDVALDTAYRL